MKRLGYPLALVFVSLLTVAFCTTVTAVALASYSKHEKSITTEKEQTNSEGSTVSR